jgi:hypothetical protein
MDRVFQTSPNLSLIDQPPAMLHKSLLQILNAKIASVASFSNPLTRSQPKRWQSVALGCKET